MNVLRLPAKQPLHAEFPQEQKNWRSMPLKAPYEIKTDMRTFYYPGRRETKSRIAKALVARLNNDRRESDR
jgi:hypothetical protein